MPWGRNPRRHPAVAAAAAGCFIGFSSVRCSLNATLIHRPLLLYVFLNRFQALRIIYIIYIIYYALLVFYIMLYCIFRIASLFLSIYMSFYIYLFIFPDSFFRLRLNPSVCVRSMCGHVVVGRSVGNLLLVRICRHSVGVSGRPSSFSFFLLFSHHAMCDG